MGPFSKTLLLGFCTQSLLLLVPGSTLPRSHRALRSPEPRAQLRQVRWQASSGTTLSAADAEDLYQEKCSLCHGTDRAGKPPAFPTLIGVTSKYSDAEITKQIRNGKGRMPAYPSLTTDEVNAIITVLKKSQSAPAATEPAAPTSPTPLLAMLAEMPVR